MNAEKQYGKSSSRTIQPKQGNGKLKFVDNRPGFITLIKLIRDLTNNSMNELPIQQKENNSSYNSNKTKIVQLFGYKEMFDSGLSSEEKKAIDAYIQLIGETVDNAKAILASGEMSELPSVQAVVRSFQSDERDPAAAAKAGTAIHQITYSLLKEVEHLPKEVFSFEKDHIDISVALFGDKNRIAVFDLTSPAQLGHTKNRDYAERPGVVYVIEISYEYSTVGSE